MKNNVSNVNFTGVRFPYRTNIKDLNKIKQFLENENNMNVIKNLDTNSVDIYFIDGIEKIGFAHQRYGNLEKYGVQAVPVGEFAKNTEILFRKISKAVKKVQQAWANQTDTTRGC